MSEARADVSRRRRISPIWIVPIVALLLGIWMLIYTLQSQGPEITIVFSTADGIEAGKTKIKLRSVEIGLVESAGLGDDLESVVVTARLDKEATPLLREDTQFWVVRPRIGAAGVSGLDTVLSGAYLQLAPGTGPEGRRDYVGLENPPVTPAGTPGLRITLTSDHGDSLGTGDPILYKGHRIGRVESGEFDLKTQTMTYAAFIEAPFDDLITTSTRFWNASGISFELSANGVEADLASLETLLVGGVAAGQPKGVGAGPPVEDGAVFALYDSYAMVNERPHRYGIEYVVRFSQSVRGLKPGAPVEYRGIPAGQVERVMVSDLLGQGATGQGAPVPVLIRLEPGRLALPDTEAGVEQLRNAVEAGVANGMRASLATGSLITGSLLVALDNHGDPTVVEIGEFAGRPELPTVATGLEGLEIKLASLLDKLNALPLEGTVKEAQQTLAGLDKLLNSRGMQELPTSLDATLRELETTLASFSGDSQLQEQLLPTIAELDRTLASFRRVLDTLDRQPNALVFNRELEADPLPPVGAR